MTHVKGLFFKFSALFIFIFSLQTTQVTGSYASTYVEGEGNTSHPLSQSGKLEIPSDYESEIFIEHPDNRNPAPQVQTIQVPYTAPNNIPQRSVIFEPAPAPVTVLPAPVAVAPVDPTLTIDGEATRFTDIRNTSEDNALRKGADFWAIARNVSGGIGATLYILSSAALKLSQTTWVSSGVSEDMVIAAAVWGTVGELFFAGAGTCEILSLKRKKQGEALAKEFNDARRSKNPASGASSTPAPASLPAPGSSIELANVV